ncbi:MAG TPA: hypothetical protein VES39_09635 [Rhodospirillales bacterium]|nr:hypothetical protein [Rhodospirillales bacterium]
MRPEQGEMCVRVLSAIAWSDGQVTDDEMERVVDLVCQLDYVDRSMVQEILHMPTGFVQLEDVRALDRNSRIRLLHDAYMVAVQDGPVDEQQRAILAQIAETVVPTASWDKVDACLATYVDYESKCRGLWGITHLA